MGVIAWAAALAWARPAQPPDPFAACDVQAAWFATQVRPRPDRRPTLWWLVSAETCPPRALLDGAPPPAGELLRCIDRRGRQQGFESVFGPEGQVARESQWDADREIGPRYEWNCHTDELIRRSELARGQLDGEVAEWLGDGGVVVTSWADGLRAGPTWRLDARGRVLLIEQWTAGVRHGRACAWRNGGWGETVYTVGIADR